MVQRGYQGAFVYIKCFVESLCWRAIIYQTGKGNAARSTVFEILLQTKGFVSKSILC